MTELEHSKFLSVVRKHFSVTTSRLAIFVFVFVGCVKRKERWMRHFTNLLNVESRVENGVHTFEGPRENRNEETPTEEEVNSAIKQLKSHKAPGFDNINSETLKAGGSILSRWIHRVISKIWESEEYCPRYCSMSTSIMCLRSR